MVGALRCAYKDREVCETEIGGFHCDGGWGAVRACPRCLNVWGLCETTFVMSVVDHDWEAVHSPARSLLRGGPETQRGSATQTLSPGHF